MGPGGSSRSLRGALARLNQALPHSEEYEGLVDEVDAELGRVSLQLAWLHRGQRALDERLDRIERSLLFRIVRWPGVRYARIRNLLDVCLKRPDVQYARWMAHEKAILPGHDECRLNIAAFARRPLISVVIVVRHGGTAELRESIESVLTQIYSPWELCICVDGVGDPSVLAYLGALSHSDGKVRLSSHSATLGMVGALKSACSLAQGEFLAFLGQGDRLSPHALYYVARAIETASPVIVYSDEDQLGPRGTRVNPLFKPAWSPSLLMSNRYPSNFLVIDRNAFQAQGGFAETDDHRDFQDVCSRIAESGGQVAHIPRILYHRRIPERQESADMRKAHRLVSDRTVSIIICSRSPRLLKQALESIRKATSYPAYEIVVAEHCPDGENPEMARLANAFDCRRIPISGTFNFSRLNNVASESATGEILVFLNDDIQPLTASWLAAIVGDLEKTEVGIVGAKLLYPSGAIQHAGVVVGIGDGAGHVNRNKYEGKYWKWVDETREVSAVTGACLGIRAEVFRILKGFDPIFPNNYNDVDLCLRAGVAGYRVLYEPAACLRHYEGQTRELHVHYDEREQFYRRWRDDIEAGDPFYSPNLASDFENAALNFTVSAREVEVRLGLVYLV